MQTDCLSSPSLSLSISLSLAVSQMGTDQSDERWWVEETCLIKTKRWNDSLMPVLDALCMWRSYYTRFFFLIFLFFCLRSSSGRRCCGHREGWKQPDEVSDYSTSSGTMRNLLNATWVSALYGSALVKYISPSSFCTLSASSARCPSPILHPCL